MEIQKKWLAVAIAGALSGIQTASAATITVDSDSDGFIIGGNPSCTLRLAVAAANSNAPAGGCDAGSAGEVDVIEFDVGLDGSTISLQGGDFAITSSMTIDASTPLRRGVTIDANEASRIFTISSPAEQVTLRGLTLINGRVTNTDGGAIRADGQQLLIDNCTLSGNSAIFGVATTGGLGGAIHTVESQLTLNDSVLSGNSSSRGGGALSSRGTTAVLNNSQVTSNIGGYGAGIVSTYLVNQAQGNLTVNGGTISGNIADAGSGGGIFVYGIANLTDVSMMYNVATTSGGALASAYAGATGSFTDVDLGNNTAGTQGGALDLLNDSQFTLLRTQVFTNYAVETGGGISTSGILTITDSTVSGNSAGDGSSYSDIGGGIHVLSGATLQMSGSRVETNTANRGGGLYSSGTSVVNDTTISENSATTRGGGFYIRGPFDLASSTVSANAADNGSAMLTLTDQLTTVTNSTISQNTANMDSSATYPSAIYSFAPITLSNSTLIGNAPSAITRANGAGEWGMTNSVIADSAIFDCVDAVVPLSVNLNNLIGDGSCAADAVELLVGDPLLGPLSDNGGATQTHLPLTGSPLVDAGSNSDCPDVDQAGMPRPIDGNADDDSECDIGSIEFVDLFPPLATITSAPDVTVAGANSYELEITYTDLDGVVDFASVGTSDITIAPIALAVQGVSLGGTASQLVVTYTLLPPGGQWAPGDSQDYTVSLNADEVSDLAVTGANPVPAGELGGFSVVIPDIEVRGNGIEIVDGDDTPQAADNTAFGNVAIGTTLSREFTVRNGGAGTVTLTSPVEIFGAGFSISQPSQTTLGPNESSQFSVTFEPSTVGSVSGQVTLLSDDPDENPYTFVVSGSGQPQTDIIFEDSFE